MKVEFIKDHNEHLAGQVKDLNINLANYLILCKVAKKHIEKQTKTKK